MTMAAEPGEHPDDLLALSLASGKTWKEAAAACGVSESTVTRRMREPEFDKRVRFYQRAAVDRALSLVTSRLADASEQLHLIATNGTSEGNRLRASIALMELSLKYQGHVEQLDRLKEAERILERQAGRLKELTEQIRGLEEVAGIRRGRQVDEAQAEGPGGREADGGVDRTGGGSAAGDGAGRE